MAHYFPYDVKLGLLAHSFLANQKARNAIVGAENLFKKGKGLDLPVLNFVEYPPGSPGLKQQKSQTKSILNLFLRFLLHAQVLSSKIHHLATVYSTAPDVHVVQTPALNEDYYLYMGLLTLVMNHLLWTVSHFFVSQINAACSSKGRGDRFCREVFAIYSRVIDNRCKIKIKIILKKRT